MVFSKGSPNPSSWYPASLQFTWICLFTVIAFSEEGRLGTEAPKGHRKLRGTSVSVPSPPTPPPHPPNSPPTPPTPAHSQTAAYKPVSVIHQLQGKVKAPGDQIRLAQWAYISTDPEQGEEELLIFRLGIRPEEPAPPAPSLVRVSPTHRTLQDHGDALLLLH